MSKRKADEAAGEMTKQQKDAKKLRFCRGAVESRDRFTAEVCLDADLREAIAWIASPTVEEASRSNSVRRHCALM